MISGTDYIFTASPLIFSFPQTWNANIIGNHIFALNGQTNVENTTLALNVTFNVTIQRGCNASLASYGPYIFNNSLSYRIFDVEAIYWFDDFVVTDPTNVNCGNFSYYLIWVVNSTYNTSTLPSFMSYNISNNSFSLFTNNSLNEGIYNLVLIGALNSFVYLDYSFTLHVLPRCTPT